LEVTKKLNEYVCSSSASRLIIFVAGVTALLFSGGCSIYMESTRPTPVDLTQFQPGENRDFVLEQLGAPQSTATESDGASCDFYKLYTRGYGAVGKIPIALAEGAADVFTLGLAEAVTTPAEGATKNELHPVAFCYKNNSLLRVTAPGNEMQNNAPPQIQAQSQSQPAVPGASSGATSVQKSTSMTAVASMPTAASATIETAPAIPTAAAAAAAPSAVVVRTAAHPASPQN